MIDDLLDKDPDENIIDSELAQYIEELTGNHEVAVLLSYNLDNIAGYYSTNSLNTVKDELSIVYREKVYSLTKIAQELANVGDENIMEPHPELKELEPYFTFRSFRPTDGGYVFNLLVAVDIMNEEIFIDLLKPTIGEIRDAMDDKWFGKHGYHLKL